MTRRPLRPLKDLVELAPGVTLLHELPRSLVALSPDGASLFVNAVDGVERLDTRTGETLDRIPYDVSVCHRVVSPDGERLALWEYDGAISVRDRSGAVLGSPLAVRTQPGTLTWSADGSLLAVSEQRQGVPRPLFVLDRDGTLVREIPMELEPDRWRACAAGTRGFLLGAHSHAGVVRVDVDAGTATPVALCAPHADVRSLASEGDRYVAALYPTELLLGTLGAAPSSAWPDPPVLAASQAGALAPVAKRIKSRCDTVRAAASKQMHADSARLHRERLARGVAGTAAEGLRRWTLGATPGISGTLGPNFVHFAGPRTLVSSSGVEVVRTHFADDRVTECLVAQVRPLRGQYTHVDVIAARGTIAIAVLSSPESQLMVLELPALS